MYVSCLCAEIDWITWRSTIFDKRQQGAMGLKLAPLPAGAVSQSVSINFWVEKMEIKKRKSRYCKKAFACGCGGKGWCDDTSKCEWMWYMKHLMKWDNILCGAMTNTWHQRHHTTAALRISITKCSSWRTHLLIITLVMEGKIKYNFFCVFLEIHFKFSVWMESLPHVCPGQFSHASLQWWA